MIKEVLKLALEALQNGKKVREGEGGTTVQPVLEDAAILAIGEALAQPEQETQAYREAAQLANWLFKTHYAQEEDYASGRVIWGLCDTTAGVISQIDNMVCKLVLPKEPEPKWVGLTDDEVRECYAHVEGVTVSEAVILMSVVRTTQAKLKEKNTWT
tara:strand:- start:364 stop:834 length:471 start_codon:yes stop_codon:yes gene_type:complete